jgi:hypothetical protein
VTTESPLVRFLRFENFDPWAAAKRLVSYWEQRKQIFGERAFLPMDMSGNGALAAQDIAAVNTRFNVILPPDQDNRTVLCYNPIPTSGLRLCSSQSRLRAVFYWFQILSEIKEVQTDGMVLLSVIYSPSFEKNRTNVTAGLHLIRNAIPVRIHSVHMVCNPPQGRKRTLTESIFPITMQFVGSFFWRLIKIHTADTKEELCRKLLEHRLGKHGIPVLLGGSWKYDHFEKWKLERKSIESKRYEQFHHQPGTTSSLPVKLPPLDDEKASFQETDLVKKKALAELEEALELISDETKAALMEARQRMPASVNKEADPIRFLRFENYNTWAAAQRLATYWSTRKKLFGERAFLRMNQTGEGTLNRDDIATVCSGYIVFLPNDTSGRSVMCVDTSRLGRQSAETRMRVGFYMASIACENDKTQKDGMVLISVFSAPKLDQTSRKGLQTLFESLPWKVHKSHIVNCKEMRSRDSFTETLVPLMLKLVGSLMGKATVVHVADSEAELCEKLEGYDLARKHLPKVLGGKWDYERFAQWQDQMMRYEWEIPAGTGHKDSGYVLEYTVKPFSELSEEEKCERKRRMNVLHSRRKRERRKVEGEVFHEQVADLKESNERLSAQNLHFEDLLKQANAMVAIIEGSRLPVETEHSSCAATNLPSRSVNMTDLSAPAQSLTQQQLMLDTIRQQSLLQQTMLIQQTLRQQSSFQLPFATHGGLTSSLGVSERQLIDHGIREGILESRLRGMSSGPFVPPFGQGQQLCGEGGHLTGSGTYSPPIRVPAGSTTLADSRFTHPTASLYPTGPEMVPQPARLDFAAAAAAILGYGVQAAPPQANPGLLSGRFDFNTGNNGNNGYRAPDSTHPSLNDPWGDGSRRM